MPSVGALEGPTPYEGTRRGRDVKGQDRPWRGESHTRGSSTIFPGNQIA